MKREEKRNEFRKINFGKGKSHPTYIYARIGDEYKYLGLTHSEVTENVRNIRLDNNPDPKDDRQSFVRPFPRKQNKSSFGKKLKGWFFHGSDKEKINNIKNK